MAATATPPAPDPQQIAQRAARLEELRGLLARQIVGQESVVREVLATVLVEGHALLVGVPGLAKTLLVRSLAELLGLEFRRIQFTPDLMPTDITGATLIRSEPDGERGFHFLRGPVFSHIILADEINRTPPKTQAALMEAMEERQVTAGGTRLPLPRPFFVLATQNPIEQEGTYPLPVTQLDRFLFEIRVDYPEPDEEFRIVQRTTSAYRAGLEPLLSRDEVLETLGLVRTVTVPESTMRYASEIARRTRPADEDAPDFVRKHVAWGAGPRGVQALIAGARATAFLDGRAEASDADVNAVACPALRHRLVRSYEAEAEGLSPDAIIERLLVTLGRYRPPQPQEPRRGGIWGRLFARRG